MRFPNLCVALSIVSVLVPAAFAESVVFPSGMATVVDVTESPYNADATGQVDATAAIQQALTDNDQRVTIYLPNGTYLVSSTLTWMRNDNSFGPLMQGQSRSGTVIRLADGTCPNGQGVPVLWTGAGVAQNFDRGVHNLTVNIGSNNPAATGIRFYGNNQSLLSDVDIISEDGQGLNGLDLTGSEQGPCMVKNLSITGFATGILCNALNGVTLCRISLQGQTGVGITNAGGFFWIDSLTSQNSVTAITNNGDMTVVNARLSGGNSTTTAVQNAGMLFARDVVSSGYQRAISSTSGSQTAPTGTTVDEFSSDGCVSLFTSPQHSMNLPIKYPPDVEWEEDLSKIVNVQSLKGGLGSPQLSDIEAFQKAIDDGYTTVVLPGIVSHTLNDTVYVRGNVRRIIGTCGSLGGTGAIVVTEGSAPVVKIQRLRMGLTIIQRSSRTLVVESVTAQVTGAGSGDIFADDVCGALRCVSPTQHFWARQYNAEVFSDNIGGSDVVVDAGVVWNFGWKSEHGGTKVTANGGALEILGFEMYCSACLPDFATTPLIIVGDNSEFCVAGLSQLSFCNKYDNIIRQTRDGETRTLTNTTNPTGHSLTLFTGYDSVRVNELVETPARGFFRRSEAEVHDVLVTRSGISVTVAGAGRSPVSLRLCDTQGRVVHQTSPSPSPRGVYHSQIPMSDRAAGFYVLTTGTGSNLHTRGVSWMGE